MGKWVASHVLDGALDVISGANCMLALAGQPTDYATAWGGRLAEAELVAGDFAKGAGIASGRRVQVAGKSAMPVRVAGIANHVALVNSATGQLLYVTTCPEQQLAAGGTVSFEGWSVEIGDPL